MSSDDLSEELTRNTANAPEEILTRSLFFLSAVLSVVTTIAIVLLLTSEAAKFFTVTANLIGFQGETSSFIDFLTGTQWEIANGNFGVLPLVSATILITVGSAIIAIPLGVGTAIYLS